MEKIIKGISIEGFVNTDENTISIQEFTDKFEEWIKMNKWSFDGKVKIDIKEIPPEKDFYKCFCCKEWVHKDNLSVHKDKEHTFCFKCF